MQHRANRNVRGRHRRTTALHSHRAPSTPLGERGRYVVAAALVAGVGVAGVTAATSGASPAPASARAARAALAASTAAPVPAGTAPTPAASSAASAPQAGADTASASPFGPQAGIDTAFGAQAGVDTAAGSAFGAEVGAGANDALAAVPQARKVKPLPLWVHPLPGAATTSCFGPRWGRLHAGVDLAAPDGTPIRAAGAGVVVAAGPAEGYGNAVLIDHGNGYLTHYGHLSAITATPGQHVAAGDQIGNEGSTGHSTGPHLHFEVHQGTYQNPIEPTAWMHEHGVDIAGCATVGPH